MSIRLMVLWFQWKIALFFREEMKQMYLQAKEFETSHNTRKTRSK